MGHNELYPQYRGSNGAYGAGTPIRGGSPTLYYDEGSSAYSGGGGGAGGESLRKKPSLSRFNPASNGQNGRRGSTASADQEVIYGGYPEYQNPFTQRGPSNQAPPKPADAATQTGKNGQNHRGKRGKSRQ
jgi:hypothetical protein